MWTAKLRLKCIQRPNRKKKSFYLKKENKKEGGRFKKHQRKKYFFKPVFNTVTEIVFYYKSPFTPHVVIISIV